MLSWLDVATGLVTPLETNRFEDRLPSWSRDGQSIYFSSNRDGLRSIYKRDLLTGTVQRMTQESGSLSAESPGSQRLVFTGPFNQLWWIPLAKPLAAAQVLIPNARPNVIWTFTGNELYFALDSRTLARWDGSSGVPVIQMPHALVSYVPSLNAAPDGRTLLCATRDHEEADVHLRVSN